MACTSYATLTSLDDEFNSASVQQGVQLLSDYPFAVPPLSEQSKSLMDVANWSAKVALRVPVTALTEKYGAYLEQLLANPFVQDQMLVDPARWRSFVFVSRAAIETSPGVIQHAHTKEARAFLRDFEAESSKCVAKYNKFFLDGGVVHAEKILGMPIPSTTGPGCEEQLIYCDYTKRRVARPPSPEV